MTNKTEIAEMEKLNTLVELAKEINSKQWFINSDEEVVAVDNDTGPDDSGEVFIGCAANIQLAKYIAAASPENIIAFAEAAQARIAELEGAVDTWRKESAYNLQGKNDAKEYARELEDINERHQNRVAVLEYKLEYAEAEIAALRGAAVPVYQHRFSRRFVGAEWGEWKECTKPVYDASLDEGNNTATKCEVRVLFTTPQHAPVVDVTNVLEVPYKMSGQTFKAYDKDDLLAALASVGITVKSADGEGES